MQNNNSQFDGSVLGLIAYQILAGVLTIFTFGLAAPWGIVMLKKYEIEHTIIDGNRLRFDGTGGSLFTKMIIWILLTIVTLGIYGFWLNYNLIRWTTKHTHMDGVNVVNNTTIIHEAPVNNAQDSVRFQ